VKVAYVLPSLQKPSGWRSHARDFLRGMRQLVDPFLVVAREDAPEAARLFPDLPLFTLPVTQQATLSTPSGLAKLAACCTVIARGNFPRVDLVHSLEAYPTGLVGSWLARRLGCPHVLTAHGTYGVVWQGYRLDRLQYRRVLRGCQMICPVSHGTARLMQQYFGAEMAGASLRPILNGNDFYRRVPHLQAMQHTPPETPTLLSVGEVKPRKGYHLSLAAFAQVKQQIPEARYWIVGPYRKAEYYLQLQKFVQVNHLEAVSFLGPVSDEVLAGLYGQASLFVLTPEQQGLHFEGFGLVYLEAGAYGVPVVGTRSGGVPDAVRDGETGLLADSGDVDGIAAAMLRLLQDGALSQRMGQANRLWAETLTWERNAQAQQRAYQELLDARVGLGR
jgi:glycosyltransferase involved in cell wall biosynthesis